MGKTSLYDYDKRDKDIFERGPWKHFFLAAALSQFRIVWKFEKPKRFSEHVGVNQLYIT